VRPDMRRAGMTAAVAAIACSGSHGRGPVWERRAAALTGQWTAEFAYSYPASTPAMRGTIDLTVNRSMDDPYPRIGIPTNYGTYAIDFVRIGGSPSGARVPALVAGVAEPDSVVVFFETSREGFSMWMKGVRAGDSIRGTWSAARTRGTIASGTFIMSRP
jgi:hypothetical protein